MVAEQPPQDGWSLWVSPDGRSATVRAPADLVVTGLDGSLLRLSVSSDVTGPRPRLERGEPPVWTVDLAEEVLRRARPTGHAFLRALIDEGGTATADRLRERTGTEALHRATLTLSSAAAAVLSRGDPDGRRWRHFFKARHAPDDPLGTGRIYDYHLPDELVPIFDEALKRLPEPPDS